MSNPCQRIISPPHTNTRGEPPVLRSRHPLRSPLDMPLLYKPEARRVCLSRHMFKASNASNASNAYHSLCQYVLLFVIFRAPTYMATIPELRAAQLAGKTEHVERTGRCASRISSFGVSFVTPVEQTKPCLFLLSPPATYSYRLSGPRAAGRRAALPVSPNLGAASPLA